jgi:hypothetical protein
MQYELFLHITNHGSPFLYSISCKLGRILECRMLGMNILEYKAMPSFRKVAHDGWFVVCVHLSYNCVAGVIVGYSSHPVQNYVSFKPYFYMAWLGTVDRQLIFWT